ncbi:MAG TPA: heat-inducible transcriptional repressor HrcA [Phycicoccus elongatus]|jgi:heat-inducible transcriptional repressor|uniref:Heat-inducible transcription repressor HrcA n=1 Tax=Phycicoccus elongatus Lp2 TaxID=1193181 RepID=N0E600_9MICO|nr:MULTISPECIES: heat-inducible transcriptional repressor HrcA [Phycicoccus]MCB1240061.1 heat-inducible transcriptional repressor HrcA [Tetrasphaera sp.]MCB9405207.1 heat-inducible transcriptional repressor HrcA [Tetrasphaera sp.]MCO5302608.1 heat-inducible transcriptional repressor HrcA [Phycicoccus sp.]CCH70844.1 Heat-inducible transcription repressor hrcA [Phycicoccus elongatus Lp2]HOA66235.1 heat-inducible transcriptional repressor HrcA [Phycicoccus elongatus]
MSEERRLAVLRAIVQDYVDTSEPVGSKALLDRHHLGVSAATIRNDMAVLEEEGLIAAPHTSAGRIPTDAGYRLFVDKLAAIKPMSVAERRAISHFLDTAVDLDDVVERTVRLLSTLTRQVALVQYPSLTRSSVRHIELVPIAADRLLVVLITTTGRVEQRIVASEVDLLSPAGEDLMARVRADVGSVASGATLAEAAAGLAELPTRLSDSDATLTRTIATALADALVEEREERVVVAGTSHLARHGAEFTTSLGPVLEALEEHVILLKLLGTASEQGALAVRIGHENPHAGLHATSMVSTGYGSGSDLVAGLGVVGPTRMDYPTTMAAVRAVATYVSRILDR